MNATLAYFFGALVGAIVTIIVTRPLQAWKEGYDAAKANYSDWDKGFEAGWNEAFKQMEKIAREWNNREVEE